MKISVAAKQLVDRIRHGLGPEEFDTAPIEFELQVLEAALTETPKYHIPDHTDFGGFDDERNVAYEVSGSCGQDDGPCGSPTVLNERGETQDVCHDECEVENE